VKLSQGIFGSGFKLPSLISSDVSALDRSNNGIVWLLLPILSVEVLVYSRGSLFYLIAY